MGSETRWWVGPVWGERESTCLPASRLTCRSAGQGRSVVTHGKHVYYKREGCMLLVSRHRCSLRSNIRTSITILGHVLFRLILCVLLSASRSAILLYLCLICSIRPYSACTGIFHYGSPKRLVKMSTGAMT